MTKYVVFTVDDRLIWSYKNIAPIFEQHGIRCTFFISGKPNMWVPLKGPKWVDMSWSQVKELHDRGFEIGNHTMDHFPISYGYDRFRNEVLLLENKLIELGIPKPVSFSYPGWVFDEDGTEVALKGAEILKELGYKYVRRGYPTAQWHDSIQTKKYTPYFDPQNGDPMQIIVSGVIYELYSFRNFVEDLGSIPDGGCGIFAAHYVVTDEEIQKLHQMLSYITTCPEYKVLLMRDLESLIAKQLKEEPKSDIIELTDLDHTLSIPLVRNWPHRSPYILAELARPYIQNKIFCDVGCAEGDQLALFSKYAKQVIGVEIDLTRGQAAIDRGFDVRIGDYREIGLPVADVYYVWIDTHRDELLIEYLFEHKIKCKVLLFCHKGDRRIADRFGGQIYQFSFHEAATDIPSRAKDGTEWFIVIDVDENICGVVATMLEVVEE